MLILWKKVIKVKLTGEFFRSSLKTNIIKLLLINVSFNFTPRHEKDVVIAIYVPFIKILLYIKRGQTKGLEVWSNLLKFVVNFIYIWEYHTSKPHQKDSRNQKDFRWHLNFNFSWHKKMLHQLRWLIQVVVLIWKYLEKWRRHLSMRYGLRILLILTIVEIKNQVLKVWLLTMY